MTYFFVVVDLAVVNHPNVWHGNDSNRLHAVQVVDDGQTVKAERAVCEMVDVLEAKAVETPVLNFKEA